MFGIIILSVLYRYTSIPYRFSQCMRFPFLARSARFVIFEPGPDIQL